MQDCDWRDKDKVIMMNQVEIKNNKIFLNGSPFFIFGTGYYPRSTAYYLEEADFIEVENDIKKIKDIGYNLFSIFVPWAEIESIQGKYRFEILDKFIDLAEKYNIFLLPILLTVGIGWQYFPYWVRGRDIYENKEILAAEVNFVKAIVNRYKNRKCILIWDLSNEMDSQVLPACNESYFHWLETLYKAVKEIDKIHPVTVGSYNEIREGMPSISGQAKIVDIISSHSFPGFVNWSDILKNEKNSIRCSYFTSFLIKINSSQKKPCFMGQFGMSTYFEQTFLDKINYRDEDYVRNFVDVSFHSSLISGGCGVIHYTLNDSLREDTLPFIINMFEGRLGAFYSDGKPKSIVKAILNFKKNLTKLKPKSLELNSPCAALLFYEDHLYSSFNDYRLSLFNSFVITRRAGIDVDFLDIRHVKEISNFHTIFIPLMDLGKINKEVLKELMKFIKNGGKVYLSLNDISSEISREILRFFKESWLLNIEESIFEKCLAIKNNLINKNFYENLNLKSMKDNNLIIHNKHEDGELLISIFPFEKYMGNINEIYSLESYYKIYKELTPIDKTKNVEFTDNPNIEHTIFKNRDDILFINHDYYCDHTLDIKFKGEIYNLKIQPGEVILKNFKKRN